MFLLVSADNVKRQVLVLDTDDLELDWVEFDTMLGYMRNGLVVSNVLLYYTEELYDEENGYKGFFSSVSDFKKYYDKSGIMGIAVKFTGTEVKNKLLYSEKYKAIAYLADNHWEVQYGNLYYRLMCKDYCLTINDFECSLPFAITLDKVKCVGIDSKGRFNLCLYDSRYNFCIELFIGRGGSVTCRRLGIIGKCIGVSREFSTAKRDFITRRG